MEYKKKKKKKKIKIMAKTGEITFVDVVRLCHDTIFIFFPIMGCWCDEPSWRSQLKSSLKVILGH